MYRVIVYEKNFTLEAPNGKILRTPLDFAIKDEEKDFWEMTIKIAGIRLFNITKFEAQPPKEEPTPIITLSHNPVRPSTAKGKIKNE